MPLFQSLTSEELLLRVGCSILSGSLIGLERLWRHKEAGLKTNTLVCLGATIFGIISINSGSVPNWSASQFSVGVLTGIGFLGSGVILQRTQHVQGINSAATIWVSAGVGVACGMGQYELVLVSVVSTLFVQYLHRWIELKVNAN